MTVQFPQIDTGEPRLSPDNYAQSASDSSFEEKFKFEQARLGLSFSPFAQLDQLFSTQFSAGFSTPRPNNEPLTEIASSTAPRQENSWATSNTQASGSGRPAFPALFDSLPVQNSSRQWLQQLFSQTGWLVPNLEAQPLFAQAFTAGKLQTNFDLQFLIDRIMEQVNLVKEKGRTELTLTLKPAELGEILLTLTAHQGIVSIQIQSDTETRKLLDARRVELASALKKAHIQCDRIEITEVTKHA